MQEIQGTHPLSLAAWLEWEKSHHWRNLVPERNVIVDLDTRVRREGQGPNYLMQDTKWRLEAKYQFFTLPTVLNYDVLTENLSYRKANRSGNGCHWKLWTDPQGEVKGASHTLRVMQESIRTDQKAGRRGHEQEPLLGFPPERRSEAGWASLGLPSLISLSGLWDVRAAPSCLVYTLIRAGEQWPRVCEFHKGGGCGVDSGLGGLDWKVHSRCFCLLSPAIG